MEAPTIWEQVHRPPHGASSVAGERYELPYGYGNNALTLLVRDPRCVFAFWEVTGAPLPGSEPVLRVYDLTGKNPEHWYAADYADFSVAGTSGWYVHTETPGLVLGAEIGLRRGSEFIPLARSNVVTTPPGRVSDETDADWMSVEQLYRYVAYMPVGTSSPAVHAALSRQRQVELSSGFGITMAHPGFSPGFYKTIGADGDHDLTP